MMTSLLIANRGEIARRIIRTARRLGVRSIVVYSTVDAKAPFVREADVAVPIGGASAADSYLAVGKILAAASSTRAAAIHPGYGFLSENAPFAEAVQAAGLIWVGAPPAAIRAMGRKDAAKALMRQAGVPVTPGYLGENQADESLQAEAGRIGYPVLIKAVAGGGGRGMRRVDTAEQFAESLAACRREALAAFGDGRVLLETYLSSPRHIEVQVCGDSFGDIVHLFERDCSLQRRHQKVIEEAPAPGMDEETRAHLTAIAVKAARAVQYVGAGTVEFIADASQGLRTDRLWFMEMNTRLQVEHPVTEAITGQDLVEWQLRIASGERLPCRQEDLRIDGHAMEARLYAENPTTGFLPSTGPLTRLRLPTTIRVDSGVEEGGEVTGHYDPLIAKLVVHERTRTDAARRLSSACGGVEVWPVHSNAAFLMRVTADPAFIAGDIDTGFIERHAATLIPATVPRQDIVRAAAAALVSPGSNDPWHRLAGFRPGALPFLDVSVAVADHLYTVRVDPPTPQANVAALGGIQVLFMDGEAWTFAPPSGSRAGAAGMVADGTLRSPMPGRIVSLPVMNGQAVVKGQTLVVLEAMKMEHTLRAPFAGVVAGLAVAVGEQVAENVSLVRIIEVT